MGFDEAYAAVLARWPQPVESVDVATPYGPTRVNVCGPEGAPPLVLLPGGGATSTVWFAVAQYLVPRHRLYAVDLMGDAGFSRPEGVALKRPADLLAWLEATLDQCGLRLFDLCGHSYGGWLALAYTLHAPQRVRRLALLDPTGCFARMSPRYLLHAAPLVLKATGPRMLKLMDWEARGATIDPGWREVVRLGAEIPRGKPVVGPRPSPVRLRALSTPTLVLLPDRSRVHDIDVVSAAARADLPNGSAMRLRGVSHHTVPTEQAAATASALRTFLV